MFGREQKPTAAERRADAHLTRQRQVIEHNEMRRKLTRSDAIELTEHYLSEMLIRVRKYVKEEANVDAIISEYTSNYGAGKEYATKQLALIAMKSDMRFVNGVGDAQWFRSGAELMSRLHDSLVLHVQEMDRLADRRHGSQ